MVSLIVKNIIEEDFGCEGRPDGQKPKCKVILCDISGNEKDVFVHYSGLNMEGLEGANVRFGSENYSALDLPAQGCSITFADYINGRTGAVRNMDLQLSQYCSYEFKVHAGENSKYIVSLALQLINGVTSITLYLSLLFSNALDAISAGTVHPNPTSIGTILLPDNPIFLRSLSITKATRAI